MDPVVLAVLVEEVLEAAVDEAALLAVAEEVAPMDANASNTADTRPPPGGGGGGALLELALVVPELVL